MYSCDKEGTLNFTVVVSNSLGNVTVNKTVVVETFIRGELLSQKERSFKIFNCTLNMLLENGDYWCSNFPELMPDLIHYIHVLI